MTGSITILQDLSYYYDATGNITHLVDDSETDSAKTVIYVYDGLNRLTFAVASSTASGADYFLTFTYDSIGNLTGRSDVGTYTYGGNSGSNYANPHAATSIGNGTATSTYTYDHNGNLTGTTGATTTAYAWNYNNSLASSTVSGGNQWYGYDNRGQRMKLKDGATNRSTFYPTKYYNAEYDSGNSLTKQTEHTFAGDTLLTTLETASSPTLYYNLTDHLGSIAISTDSQGNIKELSDYYPYGNIRLDQKSGSLTEQRKYIGQQYDAGTGLNYLNARYYDPSRGQFISEDPVFWSRQQNLYDPQTLNSYSYASNNPVNRSDPTGKFDVGAIVKAILQLIAALSGGSSATGSSGGNGQQTQAQTSSPKLPGAGSGASGGTSASATQDYYNKKFAEEEKKLVGKKYEVGANGPDAVDCSGAIIYGVRKVANPNFPDTSAQDLYDKYSVPGDGGAGTVNYYSKEKGGLIVHATTNVGNETVINPYDEAHGITNPSGTAVINSFPHGDAFTGMQLNWKLIMQTNQ